MTLNFCCLECFLPQNNIQYFYGIYKDMVTAYPKLGVLISTNPPLAPLNIELNIYPLSSQITGAIYLRKMNYPPLGFWGCGATAYDIRKNNWRATFLNSCLLHIQYTSNDRKKTHWLSTCDSERSCYNDPWVYVNP